MAKIIVLGPEFFGYRNRIASFLRRDMKNDVLEYNTFRPKYILRLLELIALKPLVRVLNYFKHRYYKKILRNFPSDTEVVLVLHGVEIDFQILSLLKGKLASAMFILYIWDDFKKAAYDSQALLKYDHRYTYNFSDAQAYKFLKFRPFFYSDVKVEPKVYDMSFIGTLHSDRYKRLYGLVSKFSSLRTFIYFYTPLVPYLRKYYSHRVPVKDVKFRPLGYDGYIKALACSVATIELPHINQKDITTRAIEVLGTQTKLITTVASVTQYDFYSPSNYFVLTRDNAHLIHEWLRVEFKFPSEDLLYKYSLKCWVSEILAL